MNKTQTKPYKVPWRRIVTFVIPITILVFILILGCVAEGSQQFSELAQAFVHGHLNFLKPIGGLGQDPILYHGKVYWGEGPFPAVLLMPFVGLFDLFHLFFYQGYIKWLLILGILFFVFRLARLLAYSIEDSLILMFGFVLASVFIGVASVSSSWLFAQVVTTFLLFWSIYEFYTRKRWWLLGIICGLLLLTRATAAPIIIFFALEFWQIKVDKSQKLKQFIKLGLPTAAAIVLIGIYNFLRFHSPFNGGYNYQLVDMASAEARGLGVFSLTHIPTNLYHVLLGMPNPVLRSSHSWTLKFPYIKSNNYGLSIFFTSPYLLYLFTKKWSSFNAQARHLLVAVAVSVLLVLSFYGIGREQLGYRYALDFLPELFVVFMIVYRKHRAQLSKGMKFLLLAPGVVNFYLMWSYITWRP